MACRGVYVFSHSERVGNAPAHVLFDQIQIRRKTGIEAPRQFTDYDVAVTNEKLDGVTLSTLLG